MLMKTLDAETAVRERYAAGARPRRRSFVARSSTIPEYLKVIPQEVIDRDYGCGDPRKYLREGETVLDLGSGTGKICFIAAQVVGPKGRVIGVDMTDDMLEVARSNAPIVAERIGYHNVEFRKGRIQDLALDLEKLEAELKARRSPTPRRFCARMNSPRNCGSSIRWSRATRWMWSSRIACSISSNRKRSGSSSRKSSASCAKADARSSPTS